MFIVERTHPNGSTSLYGPIVREKTAIKVVRKFDLTGDTSRIRPLTPWRQAFGR